MLVGEYQELATQNRSDDTQIPIMNPGDFGGRWTANKNPTAQSGMTEAMLMLFSSIEVCSLDLRRT